MATAKELINKLVDKLDKARTLEVPSVENMIKQQEAASKAGEEVKAEKA